MILYRLVEYLNWHFRMYLIAISPPPSHLSPSHSYTLTTPTITLTHHHPHPHISHHHTPTPSQPQPPTSSSPPSVSCSTSCVKLGAGRTRRACRGWGPRAACGRPLRCWRGCWLCCRRWVMAAIGRALERCVCVCVTGTKYGRIKRTCII